MTAPVAQADRRHQTRPRQAHRDGRAPVAGQVEGPKGKVFGGRPGPAIGRARARTADERALLSPRDAADAGGAPADAGRLSPAMLAAQQMMNSPAMMAAQEAARRLSESPAMRAIEELRSSPTMRSIEEL